MPSRYEKVLTIDPGKRGGKPCVRGLRITVYDVLEYLASGMSEQEIMADFPDLEAEDIRACLEVAADRERFFAPGGMRILPHNSQRCRALIPHWLYASDLYQSLRTCRW